MPMRKLATDAALAELRAFGLEYPGAHTKSPWPGHFDLAVKGKTFAYLSVPGEPFSISCKLPRSAKTALTLPNAHPTGYGLGKSGWVSASFSDDVPVAMLKEWIDESYRAQAPKRLVALKMPVRSRTVADRRGVESLSGRRRASRPERSPPELARGSR